VEGAEIPEARKGELVRGACPEMTDLDPITNCKWVPSLVSEWA